MIWYDYALLIALGTVPSFIWLFYFLRKDCHPEPKPLIIKAFLMGIIVSPIAIALQLIFAQATAGLGLSTAGFKALSAAPMFLLVAAFIEEGVKYLAVYSTALRSPELDEPVDAMIYMITAAMGFAAMENILVLNKLIPDGLETTLRVLSLRFVGATFLHALASALVGYSLALAWFWYSHRTRILLAGLVLATVFHFAFNMFVSSQPGLSSLLYSTALLIGASFLISVLFDKIKQRNPRAQAQMV